MPARRASAVAHRLTVGINGCASRMQWCYALLTVTALKPLWDGLLGYNFL
jgi:hypothetical protein